MKERAHCTPGVCPGATAHGEIVQVFVENGQPVQYGERLFAVRAR